MEKNDSKPVASCDQRRVRSFVRRTGRVTRAQQRALSELWPVHGIELSDTANLDAVFGRKAPRFLEIGFGMGDALAEMAAARSQDDFLGIDVHDAGIGRALLLLEERELKNVRILRGDAVEVLSRYLSAAALDGIMVFFPDPWPKKRHHKRRLVTPEFLTLCARALRPEGVLHMATDWAPYADVMLNTADAHADFRNLHDPGAFAPSPGSRPPTRFERRGERLGHSIFDLRYARNAES